MNSELTDLNLYGFQNLKYKCSCGELHELNVKYILAKKGALASLNGILSEILPAMRVAVISSGANFISFGAQVQTSVDNRAFNLINFIYDDDLKPTIEKASQLFSLPEDVKAVIALGNGSEAELAKYYACVMEIPFIIIAVTPELTGIFSDKVDLDLGEERAKFSVLPPYALIVDYDIIEKCKPSYTASAYGSLISCYLQLIDYKIAALSIGGEICKELYIMYRYCLERAAALKTSDRLKSELAEISVRISICRALSCGAFNNYAIDAHTFILSRFSADVRKGFLDYCGFEKLIRIYKLFFNSENDFNVFIPNISKRAEKVKELTGLSELELLKSSELATIKLQKTREENIFALKADFAAEIECILEKLKNAEKLMSELIKESGQYHKYTAQEYRQAFLYLSEVAEGYTLPAFLRDMGILDYMDGEK